MEIRPVQPPRRFTAGRNQVELRHVADVTLGEDEVVTFHSSSGSQYDIVRKAWGYYATPSLNNRLPAHGLRAALVSGADGKRFVLLKEQGHDTEFDRYLADESMRVEAWLDE